MELRGTRGGDTSYGVINWLESGWVAVRGTPGQRELTITPGAPTREYGGTDDLAYTVGGLVDGDAATDVVAGALSRAAGNDAGSYSFDMSGLSVAAAYGAKYVLPSTPAVPDYTITPKAVTAVGGVRVNSRPMDGTTDATFDTSAAEGTGVLAAELADFRAGGLVVSGVFPASTSGTHSLSVTYSLQDNGSFKAANYTLSDATDTLQGEISDVAVTVETPTDTGKELLMPPCEPDPDRRPDSRPGVIAFTMCEDHLTVESVSTASDITFYPEFTPDRHHYVVHVADSVTELKSAGDFRAGSPHPRDAWPVPGFAWAFVDGETADYRPSRHGPQGNATSNNQVHSDERRRGAPGVFRAPTHRYISLNPGVTTIEIGGSRWFKRMGASASELEADQAHYFADSEKMARKTYTLQLVWRSPTTALEAPVEPPAPPRTVDYDTDDDGLIEISSLTQLDAMRWDVDGDGYSDHGGPLHEGFPNPLLGMGCPRSGCIGYELTSDLDFDTNGNGRADAGDAYWNSGFGWLPIGMDTYDYNAVFEGNGHVVRNLFIDSTPQQRSVATEYAIRHLFDSVDASLGMFRGVGPRGVIRNLGLESVNVSRCGGCKPVNVGGLAGVNRGEIRNSYVTGAVSNRDTALVGANYGSIRGSHATAGVNGQPETPNSAPTVAAALGNITIVNESGTQTVSLSGVFDDADSDSLTITAASSDEAVATVAVVSGYSTLTVSAQSRGTATVTTTADDGNGGTVSDTFAVTVKAAPAVVTDLSSVTGLEVGATGDVSVSDVFDDADGDALTVTAASSDETIATVAVSSDGSTLTLTGVSEGTATITVTAQDTDGNRTSDTFEAPVAMKFASLIAKMKEWRDDPCCASDTAHTDRWDRTLLAFGETVADTTLTPMTADEAQGYADRGWTRWAEVAAALRKLEAANQPANQPPTVASALADVTIVNESGTQTVSLSGVFDDADSDSLTVTAASGDEAVATVTVASDHSTLTVSARARGTSTITVTANDGNGGTVSDTFTVTVKAAPTVASAISDASSLEAGATQDVSLSGVFTDADGDALTITAASSDNAIATVTVAADRSKLTLAGVDAGTATITVTAEDSDGNTASDAFDVMVAAP